MILVASYPKSGATWFRAIIHSCFFGNISYSSNEYSTLHFTQATPKGSLIKKIQRKDLFFFKTHYPYSSDILFHDSINYCINIVRNPLDVIVSKLNHLDVASGNRIWSKESINANFLKAVETATSKPSKSNHFNGGWSMNFHSWLDQKEIKMILIKYEDLLENTSSIINYISHKMDFGLTSQEISDGCELASFKNMQAIEEREITNEISGSFYIPKRRKAFMNKKVRFVNKGKSGNYMDVLSSEQIEYAMDIFKSDINFLNSFEGPLQYNFDTMIG